MSRFDKPLPPPLVAMPGRAQLARRVSPAAPLPNQPTQNQPVAPEPVTNTEPLRVGVICNPRSHQNRRAEIAHATPAPDVVLAVPRTHGELAATLAEFAARGIELLVIDGGDGTIRDVLTAAAEAFGDALPQIAILPTGKTNALALDLAVPVGWTLDAALAAAQAGGIRRRAPIVVSRPVADGGIATPPLHGFLLGAGGFVRATELAQRTHRAGAFNGIAVALATVWTLIKTIFGGPASAWRRGDRMRIVANGETLIDGQAFFLFASTLEAMPAGLHPLGPPRPGLKALVAKAPPRWLPFIIGPILLGRMGGWIERFGCLHRDFAAADVDIAGGFILDGELYPSGVMRLAAGSPIAFVVP